MSTQNGDLKIKVYRQFLRGFTKNSRYIINMQYFAYVNKL